MFSKAFHQNHYFFDTPSELSIFFVLDSLHSLLAWCPVFFKNTASSVGTDILILLMVMDSWWNKDRWKTKKYKFFTWQKLTFDETTKLNLRLVNCYWGLHWHLQLCHWWIRCCQPARPNVPIDWIYINIRHGSRNWPQVKWF